MAHGPAPRNLRHDPPVSAHATERFLVCLPTYNERENLERMIAAIDAARGRAAIPGDVLVIDDGSPDGTGELADALAATHDWVHVLHRTRKEGLGRAYLAGFRWALERDYAYILEMDCDFSHDPGRIPDLVDAARGGGELVVGDRIERAANRLDRIAREHSFDRRFGRGPLGLDRAVEIEPAAAIVGHHGEAVALEIGRAHV